MVDVNEYQREYAKKKLQGRGLSRKEYMKQYRLNNREKIAAYARERRAKVAEGLPTKREYVRRSWAKKPRCSPLVLEVRKSSVCKNCGESRWQVLQFHHRDPSQKLFTISQYKGSREKLMAEIAKCDILCANCHIMTHCEI